MSIFLHLFPTIYNLLFNFFVDFQVLLWYDNICS